MPPTAPAPEPFDDLVGVLVRRRDDCRDNTLLLTIRADDGRSVAVLLPQTAAHRVKAEHVGMRIGVVALLGVAIRVTIELWP